MTFDTDHTFFYTPADHEFLRPSRWWFASSAFPMMAGTLGPVASAFSILSLARPWRQHRPPGTAIDEAAFIDDPGWLIALNAAQLGIALLSNMFLLLNMARRMSFVVAQPVTIAGWFISSFLLIALNATGAGPLLKGAGVPQEEIMWSQAFWYGMFAAILYFVVAALMCVTVFGAAVGHYPQDFNLTTSQRTLMLQTILIMVYLLVGALVFSELQDWSYLDGVYWATVTLFTIGFGDFVATESAARALLIPFALVGVISIGLVIGSIRSLVLERGQHRIDSRILEKKRRKLLKTLERTGGDGVLQPITAAAPTHGRHSATEPPDEAGTAELARRKKEFDLMRSIQSQASSQHKWMAMFTSFTLWLMLWLVGAEIFAITESDSQNWNYFDGFYFTFVTLTTLGYGDRTPSSNAGKAFFVFWCLLALPTMTIMISNAGDTVVRVVRDVTITLGNITILPGEKSFKTELKWFISQVTFGRVFGSCHDRSSYYLDRDFGVGGYGHVKRRSLVPDDDAKGQIIRDVEEKGGTANQQQQPQQQPGSSSSVKTGESNGVDTRPHLRSRRTVLHDMSRASATFRHPTQPLPDGADLHFLLSEEIANVAQHMHSGKRPRKYTYEEWTWYLKLIGENEADATTHAAPERRAPKIRKGGERGGAMDDDWSGWSWMGVNSPLLADKEESQWIIERLIERLRRELYREMKRKYENCG